LSLCLGARHVNSAKAEAVEKSAAIFVAKGQIRLRKTKKRILEIGNWPPPVCGWSMGLVGLRKELEARGWDCAVMNLNENRRVRSNEYIDVQSGWDYFRKVLRLVWRGYAVHVRVNGETKKGYLLALSALLLARIGGRPAFLTYAGGHQQSYFPAPKRSLRYAAFWLLFELAQRIYCNSEAVKKTILSTGIAAEKVEPIPHFSSYYVGFTPAVLPPQAEEFFRTHDGVFFSYVCFRKEFVLSFLAEVVRRFAKAFPRIGFLLVGPPDREMDSMKAFLRDQHIEEAVCLLPSLPHDVFLTLMSRSLAYIRMPMTDGTCSSVLEALALKIPVLASDNATRPAGVELWKDGDVNGIVALMTKTMNNRAAMVAAIPEIELADNAKKLADSIEWVCFGEGSLSSGRLNGACDRKA
jgi:glycosyltransferase involved in cell wall biosynthesis